MEIGETIKRHIQELILPELQTIKSENEQIKTALVLINKRIDDINLHLADQSRRIDDLRVELRDEIVKNNMRIDRLYEVIVRRDEYEKLEIKILRLENEIGEIRSELKMKLAA